MKYMGFAVAFGPGLIFSVFFSLVLFLHRRILRRCFGVSIHSMCVCMHSRCNEIHFFVCYRGTSQKIYLLDEQQQVWKNEKKTPTEKKWNEQSHLLIEKLGNQPYNTRKLFTSFQCLHTISLTSKLFCFNSILTFCFHSLTKW